MAMLRLIDTLLRLRRRVTPVKGVMEECICICSRQRRSSWLPLSLSAHRRRLAQTAARLREENTASPRDAIAMETKQSADVFPADYVPNCDKKPE